MREFEEDLAACMKCGMCQSVCPLFEQTRIEADVARGKLALLEALINNMLRNPDGVSKRINKCLLCGSCAANCPSGLNVVEIFIKARIVITGYTGLSFFKKIIFQKMLARPALFNKIIGLGSKFQIFFLNAKDTATNTASLKFLSPLLQNRRITPVSDSFFHKNLPDVIGGLNDSGFKVAFFTGCLTDKIYPNVGYASIKALLRHSSGVFIPKNQGCCGIPALASGEIRTFKKLVEHNAKIFSEQKYDYLITSCATCASTIKKFWPAMCTEKDEEFIQQISSLSEKILDISQYLVNIIGIKPFKENDKTENEKMIVTYHDPCHLAKSLGIRREPRDLLNACAGYELKEMANSDKCCGMGGSFNLYYYDISSKIGSIKRENIEATNCHTVATSCPACMMQISDMLSKRRKKIFVRHPVEIYAEGLK